MMNDVKADNLKVCPVMSTGAKLAKCLGVSCALWNSYGEGGCTLADRRRFMTELRSRQ